MEKLVPPNIFVLKQEEVKNMSVKTEDFYTILIKKLREKPGYFTLNLPETIVKGFGLENGYLAHLDEGTLVYSEEINKHTLNRFFRRCSYYKSSDFPVCVCKTINKNNKFESIVFKTLADAEAQWKNNSSIIIQRFIANTTEVFFKARISFLVSKDQYSGKILWKDQDSNFKICREETINEEEIRVSKIFKEQMRNLKEILELDTKKLEISEIIADFLQDFKGNWFFVDLFQVRLDKKRYKSQVVKNEENLDRGNESFISEVAGNSLQQEIIKDFEKMLKPKKKTKKKKKILFQK
jgi:hypothetical protein